MTGLATARVLARARGSVKLLGLALVALAVLACPQSQPQPRSAFAGPPVRTLGAAELGELAAVEGFAVAVVREGEGEPAERGALVRIHYIALLPDGTELDSSHEDKPILVRIGSDSKLIEGLHEGVVGMRLGELRTIAIPSRLGYQNRAGVGVPADATLTFLVELVEITPG